MLPRHIAIVMDGNGRWAESRGLPRAEGHRAGAEAARRVTEAAGNMGVEFLTLYALSTENLFRPQKELDHLVNLMRDYLEHEIESLIRDKVRLRVIGDRSRLPADVAEKIGKAETVTAREYKTTLVLAIVYGGRDDLVRAARSLREKGRQITEKNVSRTLDTADIPDPDLVVRTGGEARLSNFLVWQAAYSELYFTKTLWPDFGAPHLKRAVESYQRRERRFGATVHADEPEKPAKKKKGRLR